MKSVCVLESGGADARGGVETWPHSDIEADAYFTKSAATLYKQCRQ